MAGCTASRPSPSERTFSFERDTFPFANQTHWAYREDPATGRMSHVARQPPPDFAHRCFVLVRAAKAFHLHADFDPRAPRVRPEDYRQAVRRVLGRSARRASAAPDRVRIPGYDGLRSLADDYSLLFREEVGGAWQSYLQRGHWRMVFPFSDAQRERTAERLIRRVEVGQPAAVHVVEFPGLHLNHALLVFAIRRSADREVFVAYDPNDPREPLELVYDRRGSRFLFPRTAYFPGGPVDVYEVYSSLCY